jgi:hypothetical protein
MADCTGKITANFLLDCEYLPVAGLTSNAIIVNFDDVDRDAVTFDSNNRIIMTNFQLKPGTTGYLFTGVKQSNSKNWTLVPRENLPNKYNHVFNGTIFNPSAANKLQVSNLGLGAKYVVIVEQLWKGEDNLDAFEVLGYDTGLILNEATNNSSENDNTIVLALGSEEGFEEKDLPRNLVEGASYATTKTAFDNLFAQASI